MNLDVGYAIGQCRDYCDELKQGEPRQVTIIVGPIRVNMLPVEGGGQHWDIFLGCNRHEDCQEVGCHYSKAARDRRESRRAERT